VRWEIKLSLDDKLSQEYSYQKLLKSDNPSSRYSRKCRGCFLGHSVEAAATVTSYIHHTEGWPGRVSYKWLQRRRSKQTVFIREQL